MRKTILLLTMLLCVVGGLSVSAQTVTVTHYKPGVRKSTFAVNDLVFIYNTNRNGDRTGFLKKNGNDLELVKEKPYADSPNLHYDLAAGASVWKIASVETGLSNDIVKLSIKPASADTYLKFDGTSNNADAQYLYLKEWSTASTAGFSRENQDHENNSGTSVGRDDITSSDNVWVVGNSATPTSYWNGTEGDFTTWTDGGHGYAFYTVVDASAEYQAKLDEAKDELKATIDKANTNYNSIKVSFNLPTEVPLTADMLFSNAEQTKTGTGDPTASLSKLIDGDASTFFHSSYEQTKASFPNEYHYLQVNLKQAVDVIGFHYTTRNLVDGPHPTVIEVQCSSDGLNFVSAATLTKKDGLPTTAGAYYTSYNRPIGLPFSSRYIRYVVKENHRNVLTSNGYPFFTMAEFGMLNFTFEDASVSKEPLNVEWYGVYGPAINAAQNVYKDKDYSHMLVSDVNAANAALAKVNAAYERYFANKSNPLYTKDPASPVVFAIKSGRSGTNYTGNWYYVFKPFEGGKIKIESFAETAYEENLYCYWYLMSDALTGYCRLYPYAETSKPMGYITVGDGENKLTNVSTTTNYVGDLYELVLTSDGNFPYALKPAGKSTYVSNYNGKDAYMGFYNVLDNGTKFATVSVTALANIESLRTLHEAYKATPTSRPADSKFGITLNTLNEEYKTVYDEAYPSAGSILTTAAKRTTAEDLATTTTKVESLPSLFHMNQPATGKFYRFKSVKHNDKRLRSDKSGNKLQCGDANDNGRESIFYLTADNKLVAYVEGQYIGWNNSALADVGDAGYVTAFRCGIDYASYTIATVDGDNKRAIYCGGTTWDRGNLNNNAHTDSGYDWVIEEVSWLPVGVNTRAGYGTLYSPVALEQSHSGTNRIKAYTGAVADGVLKLTPVEGTIPQNTPVIFQYLTGEEKGNVFLPVTADVEGDAYANNGTNGYLSGQFVTTAKAADASIYTLQNKSTHGIGMYKYIGDNIKAFRAYLPYTAPVGANALRMVFDDVTTGIEGIEVNDGGKTAIYDLSGRRVSRMTKGFYIVNGKKTLIK
ncbi:MAG: discoidin domain-containing protein [Bacteroidales bacterium]|nr:discoidin domain-containing protein [Bacteroidales bacterium]MDY4620839.1 discoidin domain-containing protein [Alloprevotella sp.]